MTEAEITVAIISAVLGSSLLTSIINITYKVISNKADKHDAKDEALRLLMLDNILNKGTQYVAKGFVDQLEWSIFEAQYKSYKTLGGDGYADKMFEAVKDLMPKELKSITASK